MNFQDINGRYLSQVVDEESSAGEYQKIEASLLSDTMSRLDKRHSTQFLLIFISLLLFSLSVDIHSCICTVLPHLRFSFTKKPETVSAKPVPA